MQRMSIGGLPFTKILILASNPQRRSHLCLDQEVRDISEGLQQAQHRQLFTLEQRRVVRSSVFSVLCWILILRLCISLGMVAEMKAYHSRMNLGSQAY